MRSTADIYRRFIYYIQETLVQPWLPSSPRTFEIFESKRHRGHTPKQVSSDFMPFFLICAFLVVVICLVSKQPKDRNDEEEEEEELEEEAERIPSMPTINEAVTESSASSVCSIPVDSIDYATETCPDCSDLSSSTRINELIPALNFSIRDHTFRSLPDIPDSARSSSYASALSVGDAETADQQVQKKRGHQKRLANKAAATAQKRAKHHHRQARACLDREWFVRRTRSGQIYGTYAF